MAAAVLAGSASAHAQGASDWPARPVRLLIGIAAGSGSDTLARGLGQQLSRQWGQPVVVENRPGANTIIATESVAKAAPDGHTLLFALDHAFTTTPHLYARIPYDPIKDFAPITLLAEFGTVLVASSAIAAKSAQELIALAKAQPGKITYGSIGSGSQMHLITEMLNNKAGIALVHVPYKGMGQLATSVLTGEVGVTWLGLFSARPHLASGKLKVLAYSGSRRSAFMPELPTFAELGYPDVQKLVWYGLLAPARTPRPLLERIHADVGRLLADPAFRAKELHSRGYEAGDVGLDEFAARIRRELAQGEAMVRISGARVE
jgi:tripartite-type tricarboxylate transporter receptor subunit TctC